MRGRSQAHNVTQEVDVFYRALGQRVRAARIDLDLTQDALASRLNLTRTSVANLEAGRQRIPVHTLARASAVLQVPIADLIPRFDSPLTAVLPPGVGPDAPAAHVRLVDQLIATPDTEGGPDAG
jgi:transcriptional regulator with XRE-family HTH domain